MKSFYDVSQADSGAMDDDLDEPDDGYQVYSSNDRSMQHFRRWCLLALVAIIGAIAIAGRFYGTIP